MSAIDIDKCVELAIELVRQAHNERKLQELTKGKVRQQVEESLGYEAGALGEKPYKKRINEAVDTTVEQLKSRANQTIVNEEGDSRKTENEKSIKPSSSGKKRKSTDAEGSSAKKSKASAGAVRDDKDAVKGVNAKEKDSTSGTSKKKKTTSTGKRASSQEDKGNFKSKETVVSDNEDADGPTEPAVSSSPSSSIKKAKRAIVSDAEDEVESSTLPKRRRKSEGSPSEVKRELDSEDKGNGVIDESKSGKEEKADETELKSDSELSVLLDDPSPKKKKEKKNVQKSKGDSEKKSRSKKEAKELSPNEEQIKKLKSFVVACGMRKVWSKELKDCETPSSQIAHLRKLLTDLGMKGRFSLEQAKAIKSKRDLEREMADVQEFAQRYAEDRPKRSAQKSPAVDASSDEDDEEEDANPSRRRKNAHQSIMAFLGDQSESE